MIPRFNLVHLILIILCTVLGSVGYAVERPTYQVKSESLQFLRSLREKEVVQQKNIAESITRVVRESTTQAVDQEMPKLKTAQRESSLRLALLDRLVHQMDKNFRGGDLRLFLQTALLEMANVDALTSAEAEPGLWKFLRNASDAMRGLPEQRENVLAFLADYMKQSITNPLPVKDFLARRDYSNGSSSQAGRGVDRDKAGSIADQRIQEMQRQTSNDSN